MTAAIASSSNTSTAKQTEIPYAAEFFYLFIMKSLPDWLITVLILSGWG